MNEREANVESFTRGLDDDEWVDMLASFEGGDIAPEDQAAARRFRERLLEGDERAKQTLQYFRSGGLRSYEALRIGGTERNGR